MIAAASPQAAQAARAAIRSGRHIGPTQGQAPGCMQANLAILPAAFASDFEDFCRSNPKPCPLLARSEPGDWRLPGLGDDIDLRADLPAYRVWRDGAVVAEPTQIADVWRDDLVSFALGCSFGFEAALQAAGVTLQHIEQGRNVAMYDTNLPLAARGPFGGQMVVSMRPIPERQVERVVEICAAHPSAHGAPVHVGDPSAIGVGDLADPDYGDAIALAAGDVPVFWACGVTPQAALRRAKLDFAVTHKPGSMLICDVPAAWTPPHLLLE